MSAPVRRARIVGAFHLPHGLVRPRVEPTAAEYEAYLRAAVDDPSILPHMPDAYSDRCEHCGRADWEAPGNCLARVRVHSNALGDLAVAIDDMHAEVLRGRLTPEAHVRMDIMLLALRALESIGVRADSHREHRAKEAAARRAATAHTRGRRLG